MRGFTLIELLVVLLIGSLLMSLVGPVAYRQYEKTLVIKEREQLKLILDRSQFDAMIGGRAISLQLQTNKIFIGDGTDDKAWYFEYLFFPKQELNVSSHGFWLQEEIYWEEHEKRLSKALNPDRVQSSVQVFRPEIKVANP